MNTKGKEGKQLFCTKLINISNFNKYMFTPTPGSGVSMGAGECQNIGFPPPPSLEIPPNEQYKLGCQNFFCDMNVYRKEISSDIFYTFRQSQNLKL